MCEFSEKLIAWLDRELTADEAADVERHVECCSECRSDVDEYKRASCEFDAYCEQTLASCASSRMPRWLPVASAAGAAAALLALLLAWPRIATLRPVVRIPQQVDETRPTSGTGAVLPVPVVPIRGAHRRHPVAPVQIVKSSADPGAQPERGQNTYFSAEEPIIQIAIPADEMLPPGTVPEGIHFAADLTIAADGSAERLRLRPQLAGFERRTTQP